MKKTALIKRKLHIRCAEAKAHAPKKRSKKRGYKSSTVRWLLSRDLPFEYDMSYSS